VINIKNIILIFSTNQFAKSLYNFLLSIIAIKLLNIEDYSVFVLVFSINLINLLITTSFVTSPATLIFHKNDKGIIKKSFLIFIDQLYLILIILLIPISILLSFIIDTIFVTLFSITYLFSSFSLEFFYKKYLLINYKGKSFFIFFIKIIFVICFYLFNSGKKIDLNDIFLVYSIINFISIFYFYYKFPLKIRLSIQLNELKYFLKIIKWTIPLVILNLLNDQLFFINSYQKLGEIEVSTIRGFLTIVSVLNILTLSLDNIVPKIMEKNGNSIFLGKNFRILILTFFTLIIFGYLFFENYSDNLIKIILSKELMTYSYLLKYFFIIAVINFFGILFIHIMRMNNEFKILVINYFMCSLFLYTVGISLVEKNGIDGYVVSVLIYTILNLSLNIFFYFKNILHKQYE